jgi:hypothetical protein
MSDDKELVPLQVRQIDFYGDEITAVVLEQNGRQGVSVPLRPICEYLGLSWSSQLQRLREDEVLSEALSSVLLSNTQARQRYSVICIELEFLPGWLFTLNPKRVRPDLQDKIQKYRRDCYRVLWEAFQQGSFSPAETVVVPDRLPDKEEDARIEALTEQIDMLSAVVTFLRDHRQALLEEREGQAVVIAGQQQLLERTDHIIAQADQLTDKSDQLMLQLNHAVHMLEQLLHRQGGSDQYTTTIAVDVRAPRIDTFAGRLSPEHEREVRRQVEQIVSEIELQSPDAPPLAYAFVYGRLKNEFGVSSYKEIPDEHFDEVMEYLQEEFARAASGEGPQQGNPF